LPPSQRGTGIATIAFYPAPESRFAGGEMEKVVLLCVLIGVITALAELSRAPQPGE
jgi:hypothetical protein